MTSMTLFMGKKISKFEKLIKENFDTNYDPNTSEFWKYYSWKLAEHHSNKCKDWWHPNKFDWSWSAYLTEFMDKQFLLWWDPEKFHWKYSKFLYDKVIIRKEYKKYWESYYLLNNIININK